jgi:hypothetical protein
MAWTRLCAERQDQCEDPRWVPAGGTNYAQTSILRGLNLEIEGRGNGSGELLAEKIRFNEADMRVARAVESRAAPLEERATDTETNLLRLKRMRSACQVNWKNSLPFQTQPAVVRKPHRQPLMQPSPA